MNLCTIVAMSLLGILTAIVKRALYVRAETPIQRRLIDFKDQHLLKLPRPTLPGPERAVTLQALINLYNFFENFIRERNAYYLDSNIIRKLTVSSKLSFAEVVGPSTIVFFVSHYWGSAFGHFMAAIRHHAKFAEGSL